jgi:hypothetical protein
LNINGGQIGTEDASLVFDDKGAIKVNNIEITDTLSVSRFSTN